MKSRRSVALLVAFVAGAAASTANAQSLSTLFTSNNGGSPGGGVYFQAVVGPAALEITGFDTNTSAPVGTPVAFRVYTAASTFLGNEGNPGAWTLVAEGSGTSAGTDFPTSITLTSPFTLDANTSYGMAITLSSTTGTPAAQAHRYSGTGTSPAPGLNQYSNSDITLNLGSATNVLFGGSPFNPRIWNGTIYYSPADPTVVGACCFGDGTCQFIMQGDCVTAGGSFRGAGVTCAAANCPQPGACCLGDGTCTFVLESACTATGGNWTSAGTTCAAAGCPQPRACCFFDGSCTMLTPIACSAQAGASQPAGSTCATITCPGIPGVFYANCNLTTGSTSLSGVNAPSGSMWSEAAHADADPTTANDVAGFAGSGAFRLADDFVVPAGGLNLAYVKIPAYTTGATTLTMTGATLQIWNGPPNDPTSQVIFGDTTTNRLAHAELSDVYRIWNTLTGTTCGGAPLAAGTTRRLQWGYIAVNETLAEGTYWLDWNFTGAAFAPGATSSTAIGRQCDPMNANAMQLNVTWAALSDPGYGCFPQPLSQDMYFELLGTVGAACYANCDNSTTPPILNVDDFTCFINQFATGLQLPHAQQVTHYANCDNSTTAPALNVDDFTCFINAFAAGCP